MNGFVEGFEIFFSKKQKCRVKTFFMPNSIVVIKSEQYFKKQINNEPKLLR